jgi:hypothetical protein
MSRYLPRLIFNFTPTNLPSLSKITPAASSAATIKMVAWERYGVKPRQEQLVFPIDCVGKSGT